ncbi:MAG: EamA family transporter [bacterium]|nr:EamA family transporter [bacterium]
MSFAIASAISLGIADYLAGVTLRKDGRTSSAITYTLISLLLGVVVVVAAIPLARPEEFTRADFWWAVAAGVVVGLAMPLLMIGMGRGPIAIVAPVLALVSMAVPAIVGPLLGDSLSRLELIGLLVAFPAAVLVATSNHTSKDGFSTLQAVAMGALAGGLLGCAGIFFGQTSPDSGIAPGVVSQVTATVLLLTVALASGQLVRPKKEALMPDVAVGVLTALAVLLSVLAYQLGPVAIVAAVIALAPGPTILLAWLVTKEQISPLQLVGFALGAASVVLFALG